MFSGLQLVVMGLSVLVTAFLLRRSAVLARRSRSRNPAVEAANEIAQRERAVAGEIHRLEIRLHDYGREMEARMHTQIAVLDRLVLEADREIARLDLLLKRTATSPSVRLRGPDIIPVPALAAALSDEGRGQESAADENPLLPAEQRRMIAALADAGFSAAQIASLVDRPQQAVDHVLGAHSAAKRADAA